MTAIKEANTKQKFLEAFQSRLEKFDSRDLLAAFSKRKFERVAETFLDIFNKP